MIRLLPLLALLTACGGPQGPCADAAERDPTVQHLRMLDAGSTYQLAKNENELAYAIRQARLKCLQAAGLSPPGGVQSATPKPRDDF